MSSHFWHFRSQTVIGTSFICLVSENSQHVSSGVGGIEQRIMHSDIMRPSQSILTEMQSPSIIICTYRRVFWWKKYICSQIYRMRQTWNSGIFTHCFPNYKQPSWCKMLFCLLWLFIAPVWWVNIHSLFLVIEEIVSLLMYVNVCSHTACWKIAKRLSRREICIYLISLPLDKAWGCWGKLSSTYDVKLGRGRRGSGQICWHSLT